VVDLRSVRFDFNEIEDSKRPREREGLEGRLEIAVGFRAVFVLSTEMVVM